MPKKYDLAIGSKYGYWTIIELDEPSKFGRSQYKCMCKCGVIKSIGKSDLKKGYSIQCNSCFHDKRRKNFQSKEIGKTYNGWTVIHFYGIIIEKNRTHSTYTIEHICGYKKTLKNYNIIKYKQSRCWKCHPKKIKSGKRYRTT